MAAEGSGAEQGAAGAPFARENGKTERTSVSCPGITSCCRNCKTKQQKRHGVIGLQHKTDAASIPRSPGLRNSSFITTGLERWPPLRRKEINSSRRSGMLRRQPERPLYPSRGSRSAGKKPRPLAHLLCGTAWREESGPQSVSNPFPCSPPSSCCQHTAHYPVGMPQETNFRAQYFADSCWIGQRSV